MFGDRRGFKPAQLKTKQTRFFSHTIAVQTLQHILHNCHFFRLSALSNFFENEAGHNWNNSLPELDHTKSTEIQCYKWFD